LIRHVAVVDDVVDVVVVVVHVRADEGVVVEVGVDVLRLQFDVGAFVCLRRRSNGREKSFSSRF
jgi:hypothetical protein